MAGRKRNDVVGTGAAAVLARRLRGMRDDRGLTLREVAHKSGYSQASLSTAESGRRLPSWDLVQAFVQSCGEDPALWRQLWELAGDTAPAPAEGRRPGSPASGSPLIESPLNPSPVATPPVGAAPVGDRCPRPGAPTPGDARGWAARRRAGARRWLRPSRSLPAAAALVVVLVIVALAWSSTTRSPRAQAAAGADPSGATNSPPTAPVPERRHGPLVLVPGEVADLDTVAAGWGVQQAPGSAVDDIWFSITDNGLHGDDRADIAVLPAGSVGTFPECAREQNYGTTLDAPNVRPGQLVCDITSDNRVALLRIVDAQYTDKGLPDQITFDVVVWVPFHRT